MRLISKEQLLLFLLIIVMSIISLLSLASFGVKSDRTAPSAPANLHTKSVTSASVSLTWSKSTDNVGVSVYNVYRNNVFIGKTTTNTYTSAGLSAAKTYIYYVKALDAAGNISADSNILSVTTPSGSNTLPGTAPSGSNPLSGTASSGSNGLTETNPAGITTPVTLAQSKKVVGYYAAWAAYSGFTPDKLDAGKLTHINYAFANIGSNLKIAVGYPDIDLTNFVKLNALKKKSPNLKTIISVGGWSWSDKFSDAALTDASRTAFADSCVDFIVKYGFNGIDIDWEYPVSGGLPENKRRSEDKQNFTLLMQKIREKLIARSHIDGKQYLLTMAGASNTWYINNTELGKIAKYVDFANIMTYDIHGTWDQYTDFNAPLYNNTDTSPEEKWSVDSSVTAWLGTGFTANKLVMGVPFYGHKYNSVRNANKGLYQTFSEGASVAYSDIVTNYLNAPGYVKYFQQQSKVPWLFNGSTFISYEDVQSIGYKAQYIKNKNLSGAAIWELSQDPDKVLLGALCNGMK